MKAICPTTRAAASSGGSRAFSNRKPPRFATSRRRWSTISLDRLVSLVYPDNDSAAYSYNPRGLLESVSAGGAPVVTGIDLFSVRPAGSDGSRPRRIDGLPLRRPPAPGPHDGRKTRGSAVVRLRLSLRPRLEYRRNRRPAAASPLRSGPRERSVLRIRRSVPPDPSSLRAGGRRRCAGRFLSLRPYRQYDREVVRYRASGARSLRNRPGRIRIRGRPPCGRAGSGERGARPARRDGRRRIPAGL